MAKPKNLSGLGSQAANRFFTPADPEPEPDPIPKDPINARKSPAGRPSTIKREIEKSSQEGLPENWTRATFIVREDLLAKLKDFAWLERRSLKDVINEILEIYLQDKEINDG